MEVTDCGGQWRGHCGGERHRGDRVVEDSGEDIVVRRDIEVTEVVEDNGEDVVVERDMEVTGCGGQWRGRCGGEIHGGDRLWRTMERTLWWRETWR